MKRSILAITLTTMSLSVFANETPLLTGVPPVEYQVELSNENSEFFTVEVKGNSYERGYQQGRALRKVIRPAVARFKYDLVSPLLESLGTEYKFEDYAHFFKNETGLMRVAIQQAPMLVEEIRGIADGANMPFEDIFMYNLNFDETFWVIEAMTGIDPILAMEKANKDYAEGHCSHGSVWGNDRASVAYTLDWVRQFEGTQALIKHVKEDGTVLLMTSYAGTLIGHGINATNGYTFTPHSKFQLEHDVNNGLAQIFVYRKLVEAGSVDKAIAYLHHLKPAAGLGYALTDYRGTRTFEVSANKIAEFKTKGDYMAVANVARANNDLSSSYKAEFNFGQSAKSTQSSIDMNQLPEKYWDYNHDSVERFNMISEFAKSNTPDSVTPAKWQTLFSQSPINKPVNEKLATSNLWHVVDIDKEYIEYSVSPAAPGALPLETYRFKYQ